MTSRWHSRVVELLSWWIVLTALELLLVTAVDGAEVVLAVALGLIGASFAVAARVSQPASWSLPRWSLRALLLLPVGVVRDSAAVLVAAARGDTGSWRSVPIAGAAGDHAAARGARAAAALLVTASPSTVVVGVAPRSGEALVHDLRGRSGSRLERAVSP